MTRISNNSLVDSLGTVSLNIGNTPITNGTAGRILFQDNISAILQQSSLFSLDTSTPRLTTPNSIRSSSGTLELGTSTNAALSLSNNKTRPQDALQMSSGMPIEPLTGSTDLILRTASGISSSVLIQDSVGDNIVEVNSSFTTTIGNQLELIRTTFPAQKIEINSNFATIGAGIRAGGNNKDFILSAKDSRNLYLSTDFSTNITQVQFGLKHNNGVLIAPDASISMESTARLQVDSTTQGFLPPRMTTTQINAIASPVEGLMAYDSTLQAMVFYNGTTWATI